MVIVRSHRLFGRSTNFIKFCTRVVVDSIDIEAMGKRNENNEFHHTVPVKMLSKSSTHTIQ